MKPAKRGFTLVELMIVVAIIGVLVSLAIVGVRRYLLNSKSAEARSMVGRIVKDGIVAYDRDVVSGNLLAVTTSSGVVHHLCTSSVAVPTSVPVGSKYQSNPTIWNGDPGWNCLKFMISDPQYYMYQFISSSTAGAIGDTFTALANGDLNGNGTMSTYFLSGQISTSGDLFVAPTFFVNSPDE